jgi:hypothetical protein
LNNGEIELRDENDYDDPQRGGGQPIRCYHIVRNSKYENQKEIWREWGCPMIYSGLDTEEKR